VECLKIVTKVKSERIAKFAFDYATRNNRKKVTAVHKANIMKLGDGLFLRSCQEVRSNKIGGTYCLSNLCCF
jgi:isocitrate dehydrogenase (NAD+)